MTSRAPFLFSSLSLLGRTACGVLLLLPIFASSASSGQQSAQDSESLRPVEMLVQEGNLNEAKNRLLDEMKRKPLGVDGYNLLGIIESGQQNYAGAVEAFHEALTLAPKSVKTHNNLGNVYVAQKQLDLAEKEFRSGLQLEPANKDGNYNLGVLLMAKGSPAEAIRYFKAVRPPNTATTFNLIHAYFESKQIREALRLSAELSSQHEEDVQVHFSLGVMLASEQQLKAAELELEKADALRPGTFEILYNLGQALYRDGKDARADLSLNRALKLKPESPETLYLLAQVYSRESRPLDALDLLLRARKIAPEDPDILYLMAKISISQNYFEDAIPLLLSGLERAPLRPDMLASLGESYFMSGKVDKAVEEFKKLIEVDPSARSYSYLGTSYRQLGRFDEAKQYFQKGLSLDPKNSSCLFNLGLIAERQGDPVAAEARLQEVLRLNPEYPDALLELANLRTAEKKLPEAASLLRRYVQVSHNPATGYYKLAMIERNLHQTAAADQDLNVFQTLSKNAPAGAYPYEHLFDYLDSRSKLAPGAREELDLAELQDQNVKHPGQPENLYLLTEAYLKAGRLEEAKSTVAQLDELAAGDYRTLTGVGVLLARYHIYDDAMKHFQSALQVNPSSDEVKFDLAGVYFRRGLYKQALATASQISEKGRTDNACLTLLGDIYAHVGEPAHAEEIFRDAIGRNPDNDQDYLALSLLQLRAGDVAAAKGTLTRGQARVPGSGKLIWGLGLASALEGKTAEAETHFERALELLPEWPGSYSTLGVFYYETGQIDKAKEVLDRFKTSGAVGGGLDVRRIQQTLEQAPPMSPARNEPMSMVNRQQLLQLALSLADRTL